MPLPNLGALRAVADRLDGLQLDYAFTGGAIVNLLLDHPELSPVRPTDDVDVILEVTAGERYADLEERLRRTGFDHDMRPGSPRCRWVLDKLIADIMPTDGALLGLNTAWFREALMTATVREFAHTRLRLVSPVAFLATKYAAFLDRGEGDYYSTDLEDFVTVVDGRAEIAGEVAQADNGLRGYVATAVRELIAVPIFLETLSGHLPSDSASQQRLPLLRSKLQGLAAVS